MKRRSFIKGIVATAALISTGLQSIANTISATRRKTWIFFTSHSKIIVFSENVPDTMHSWKRCRTLSRSGGKLTKWVAKAGPLTRVPIAKWVPSSGKTPIAEFKEVFSKTIQTQIISTAQLQDTSHVEKFHEHSTIYQSQWL